MSSRFGIRVSHGDFQSWAGYSYDRVYAFPTADAAKEFIKAHWTQLGEAWKRRHLSVKEIVSDPTDRRGVDAQPARVRA